MSDVVSGHPFHYKVLNADNFFDVYLQTARPIVDVARLGLIDENDLFAKSSAFKNSWLGKALLETASERLRIANAFAMESIVSDSVYYFGSESEATVDADAKIIGIETPGFKVITSFPELTLSASVKRRSDRISDRSDDQGELFTRFTATPDKRLKMGSPSPSCRNLNVSGGIGNTVTTANVSDADLELIGNNVNFTVISYDNSEENLLEKLAEVADGAVPAEVHMANDNCQVLSEYIFSGETLFMDWLAEGFLHGIFAFPNAKEKLVRELRPKEWALCIDSGIALFKRRSIFDDAGKFISEIGATTELMGQFYNTDIMNNLIHSVALPIIVACAKINNVNLVDSSWKFMNGPQPAKDLVRLKIEKVSQFEYGFYTPNNVQVNYFYSDKYSAVMPAELPKIISVPMTVTEILDPSDSRFLNVEVDRSEAIVEVCRLNPKHNERRFALVLQCANPEVELHGNLTSFDLIMPDDYNELFQVVLDKCKFMRRLVSFF